MSDVVALVDARNVLRSRWPNSADEWLVREARHRHERGERVWLVTSDRALRAEAAPHVDRIIGGGTLAAQL